MAETGASLIFVTRKWPPAMGGMETYSMRLVEELRRRREVELLALPGADDGSVPGTWQLFRFGLATLARILFGRPLPGVIHVGDMASWPFAVAAQLRRPSIQIVLSAHGTDVSYVRRNTTRGRLYAAYMRLGATLLDSARIIANSMATANACRQAGFCNIDVVPLASDLLLTYSPPTANSNILFAGRLIRQKGLAWFVDNVLPLLPSAIGLDVAGSKWSDEEAKALGNERVNYLGVLDQHALANAYANAMCVVVPNIEMTNGEFEGFGLVAVEAAAAGGIVLASDIGGLRDAVRNGVTGFHVKAGDAPAWAAKITEIHDWDRVQRHTFVASSLTEVSTQFSWDRVARETEAAYDR